MSGLTQFASHEAAGAARGIDTVINMIGHHRIGSGLRIMAAKLA